MGNKEKMIKRWMLIASAVFTAEDAISAEWTPKLRAAKGKSEDERLKTAEEYLRAIATEIVTMSTVHELLRGQDVQS